MVSHDRWLLDEACDQMWEVDGQVHAFEGGYSAYVLAQAERDRNGRGEAAPPNLARKELAWLRRGPQARTSKPKFRIDAANALIADVPQISDKVALPASPPPGSARPCSTLEDVSLSAPAPSCWTTSTWRIGPGERTGVLGVNGAASPPCSA